MDGGSRQYRYGYDGAGRLTGVTLREREVSVDIPYETDGAGNRICVRCGGAPGV
ncbi:hypothetical protein ACK1FJ_004734 [Salmonella enterica]|nr:hypothetical protein [Salmonella enterica]